MKHALKVKPSSDKTHYYFQCQRCDSIFVMSRLLIRSALLGDRKLYGDPIVRVQRRTGGLGECDLVTGTTRWEVIW